MRRYKVYTIGKETTSTTLNKKDFERNAIKFIKQANRRLKTLKRQGLPTKHFKLKGGKIPINKNDFNQLESAYFKAMEILGSKSSTVSGAKEIKRNIVKNTGLKNNKEIGKFYDTLHKLQELDPYRKNKEVSEEIVNILKNERNVNDNWSYILKKVNDDLNKNYIDKQEFYNSLDFINPFEI